MDSHEEALFQAVLAEPEPDAPRLVLADWYEEHGQPERAEFIRLQCRLAERVSPLQLAEQGVDPIQHELHLAAAQGAVDSGQRFAELEPLLLREAELLYRWRRRWNGWLHRRLRGTPLAGQVKSRRAGVRGWAYQRGFVQAIAVDLPTLQHHSDILVNLGPIRYLRLHVTGQLSTAHWEGQLLRQIQVLRVVGGFWSDVALDALTRAPALSALQLVDLRCGAIWWTPATTRLLRGRTGPPQILSRQPADGRVVASPPRHQQRGLLARWLRLFGLGG